jgi:hypothetical protein
MKTTSPGAIPRVRLAKIAHEFGTPLGSFSQKVISRRLPGFVGQNGTTPYALGFVWPRSRAEFAPPWVRSAKIRRVVRTRWVRSARSRAEFALLGSMGFTVVAVRSDVDCLNRACRSVSSYRFSRPYRHPKHNHRKSKSEHSVNNRKFTGIFSSLG